MKQILSIVFLTCFSMVAAAEIYLSPELKSWVDNRALIANQTISVKQKKLLIILKQPVESKYSIQFRKTKTAEYVRQLQQQLPWLKDGRSIDNLWAINGFIAKFTETEVYQVMQLWQIHGIYDVDKKISISKRSELNGAFPELNIDFTYGLKNIKVPDLKKIRPELTGAGIKIGVLDTGIYSQHPDLKGRLGLFKNFSPSSENAVEDPFGHGTHVSGTIAGGSMSNVAIGVAPQVELVVGRIFDGNGESTKELILKAMQWMLDPDENPETSSDIPRVVNNSWGDSDPYNDRDPQDDPFCLMIDVWLKAGIVPVFTAGNSGPNPKSINVPGACPGSLTVGATEQYDRSPYFSSEGPTSWKTVQIIKPDVVAPGVDIKSAGNWGNEYEVMSGTSMSAPHVSGALALLFQAKPQLTNLEAIQLIKSGVKDLGSPGMDTTFGHGRIDILKSVELILQK